MTILLLAFVSTAGMASADLIHLKNGKTVKVDRWWEEQGEIRYRRAGGVVGIAKDQVARIEATAPESGAGSPAPRGARASARPATGSRIESTPPGAPESPSPGETGALAGADPDAWRERLKVLEASMSRSRADESMRREAAVLYTLLGNLAARNGDLDSAESSYRLAIDNDPHLEAPILNLARVRLMQGRNDEAERLIDDALAVRADDPAALALLGEVSYRSDRLPEAIELWEKSLAARPDEGLQAKLQKARKELSIEQDYYRSDAAHFTLKYDGEKASEALGREVLEHLESAYADLTTRFNVYPPSTIIVTLYPREAFHDATDSPRWVGGLFDGQIRIPVGGLTRLNATAKSVLTHELTHAIVFHKTRGTCPKWLQEGIAQWIEGKSARRAAADLARKHAGATPAELAEEFSYPLALSLVEHFLATWTSSHLLDLLDALGHGSDLDSAFQTSTGVSYEEFLSSWLLQIKPGDGAS